MIGDIIFFIRVILVLFLLITILSAQNIDDKTISINNISFPIKNNGDNGDTGIIFDSISVGFSAGFYITGYENDSLWSNGVFHSNRILDYLPGNVGSNPNNELNKIYSLSTKDSPFDSSWQRWKEAVKQGAYFYDGDNDGIYNPTDLNGNGIWDIDEDRPDLIGDITTWSVFNDSKPTDERLYNNVTPKAIEIGQTVFAYSLENDNLLNNVIFIRYTIKNVGTVSNTFDSVYFSLAVDHDIGNYGDDLTGTDISRNSTFAFNQDEDEFFGLNPPAIYLALLQGPIVSNILNKVGINRRGPIIGEKEYSNSHNLVMSSSSSPRRRAELYPIRFADPQNKTEARYIIEGGKYHNGNPISVFDFELGNGKDLGEDADTINSKFMFSGNPIKKTGWLSVYESDWRTMNSTGPFKLKVNEPLELIYAYIVARGDSPLSSLELAGAYTDEVIQFYKSNFTKFPTTVMLNKTKSISSFKLEQNYPNPFNPYTIINYSIPNNSYVKLTIYNSLGQIVEVLVNHYQTKGKYKIKFNSNNLTSGIYYYRIEVGEFTKSMKMVLLK